jgi:hypothetical protein
MNKNKKQIDSSEVQYKNDDGWKFFVNDKPVTEEEYIRLMDEHLKWIEEQYALKLKQQIEAEKEANKKYKKTRISKK